jgi:hypothetical protein
MRSTAAAGHDGATATSSVHATAITSGNASQITKCGWSTRFTNRALQRGTSMSSWITQLITLLAVAVGALASFVSTRLIDRSRWRREERFRWDTKKLECYYEYANAIMHYINIGFRLSIGQGLAGNVLPMDTSSDSLKALDTAEAEHRIQWVKISMIGGPSVNAAADKWNYQAWRLEQFARGKRRNQAEFDQAAQARRQAERFFYKAVRADLGVGNGDLPRSWPGNGQPSLPPEPSPELSSGL